MYFSLLFAVMCAGFIVFLYGYNTNALNDAETDHFFEERISIVVNSLGMTFPEGLDENNNPYLDYIKQNTQLDIEVILPPSEGYEDKLNMIMASGNYPDLINVINNVWVSNYVKQDALMPLDDLIDRYGPALKEAIPEEAWDKVRFNGSIYAVPSINEVKGVEIMYARKDWLDKLGLQPPQTLEEYYEVIKAFTLNDPDGNGLDDTIGLLMTENLGRSAPFFGAYGVQLGQWTERDGRLVYSDILPETKEALAYLNTLYEEGLLDPEFPINRNKSLEQKIVSGKVGLYSATWYDTRGPIALNKSRDPNAEWIPLAYPTGPKGHKGVYDRPIVRQYSVIPANSNQAPAVIKFLNFIAGEGQQQLKLGFENEVWQRDNEKIITNFSEHDKHLYRGIYSSLVDVAVPEMVKLRLDSLGEHFQLYNNLQLIEQNLIQNEFTGLPMPAMGKFNHKLTELVDIFTQIIVGVIPLNEFDHYVEWWRSEGGDEMTREVNEWYDQTVGRGGP
ncbi:extracellular solute-binding protein [Paenibacillus abyssi]